MHTVTLYDSAFLHKNRNLSPVHHLQCDLTLHDVSRQMLKTNGLIENEKKFPYKLHCVLSELPTISFNSNWDTGGGTKMFDPLGMTNEKETGTITKIMQVVSQGNFIPIVQTNEFTQHVMQTGSTMSMNLKFNVYTDTYNNRYNFESTPYETWLKMLYFSTAPLLRSTYKNYFTQLLTTINSAKDADIEGTLNTLLTTLKDLTCVVHDNLPFTEKCPDYGQKAQALVENIEKLVGAFNEYVKNANTIGQLCWDVAIPKYICSTLKTDCPVLWNIRNFSVEPSVKFTRGVRYNTEDKMISDVSVYRPRPLYMTFNVTLETNQVVTRDQYLKLLCGNTYDKTKTAKSNNT